MASLFRTQKSSNCHEYSRVEVDLAATKDDTTEKDSASGAPEKKKKEGNSHGDSINANLCYCCHRERLCWLIVLCLVFMVGRISGYATAMKNYQQWEKREDMREALVVSDAFLETSKGMQVLRNATNQIQNTKSVKVALQTIVVQMGIDDQVASSCHPLLHSVGSVAFNELGFNGTIDDILGTKDNNTAAPELLLVCNAAFMHGITENFFTKNSSFVSNEQLKEQIDTDIALVESKLCNNSQLVDYHLGQWECYHGIGHGMLSRINLHTKQSALSMATQACPTNTSCANGIWMEHYASTPLSPSQFDETRAMQMCYDIPNDSTDCFLYATIEFLLHHPRQYVKAIEYCELIKEPLHVSLCTVGLGSHILKENFGDFQLLEHLCLRISEKNNQRNCFTSGVRYYKFSTGALHVPKQLCQGLSHFNSLCS